ncbi:hypothetical protein [Nesterenkonia pannonica]|uniref:ABC transporter permease n=1 Tax=Nesterenkonia pannonica TaxID=1548602 RepID=UPI002164491A|nr:hypothetical protein [Nesterenkonia pannonica]
MTQTDLRPGPSQGSTGQDVSDSSFSIGSRRVLELDGSRLLRVGARPSLGQYLKELWHFRHFLFYDSRSRVSSQNNLDSLGRAWMLINPMLQALVYLTIFGIILETSRGVINFIGYLIIGVFTFRFITSAVTGAPPQSPTTSAWCSPSTSRAPRCPSQPRFASSSPRYRSSCSWLCWSTSSATT